MCFTLLQKNPTIHEIPDNKEGQNDPFLPYIAFRDGKLDCCETDVNKVGGDELLHSLWSVSDVSTKD